MEPRSELSNNDGFGQAVLGNPWGKSAAEYSEIFGRACVRELLADDGSRAAMDRIVRSAWMAFGYAELVLQEEALFATAVPR